MLEEPSRLFQLLVVHESFGFGRQLNQKVSDLVSSFVPFLLGDKLLNLSENMEPPQAPVTQTWGFCFRGASCSPRCWNIDAMRPAICQAFSSSMPEQRTLSTTAFMLPAILLISLSHFMTLERMGSSGSAPTS
jgi:hypothetical protein